MAPVKDLCSRFRLTFFVFQLYLIVPLAKKMKKKKHFQISLCGCNLRCALRRNMSNDLLVFYKAFVRDHISVPSEIV